jgi:SAM-dependent MidA family methyltransferase
VTPCELFKPYYGFTVANYMVTQMENMKIRMGSNTKSKGKTVRILEIGPGTGTMADSILEFFKHYNLEVYREECEYIMVEISPYLA